MTLFGDELNAVNISGIIVIFMGVFLYKVTLHINHQRRDGASAEIDSGDAEFSQVLSDEYENEVSPQNLKRLQKNSDPDLALRFSIDDEMDEDLRRELGASSQLRGRSSPHASNENFEIDDDEEDLVLV